MSLAAFEWTSRARPIVELGVGDARIPTGQAVWDVAKWDDPAATWAGDEPTWRDVTCDVRTVRLEYGRQATTDRYVAGVASIVVDNASGWADPNASVDPAVLTMRPGRAIRVGIAHATLGTFWRFRGFIDAVRPTYDPTATDTVELECIDALGEVNRAKLQPVDPPVGANEVTSDRVDRILDAARWSDVKRDVWNVPVELAATDLGGQVADLLGRTADSAGASVFGDYDGNVALRYNDWQTFLPGSPPDGTIGNVETGHTIPGVPGVAGYLTPTVGTVSTPDTGWSGATPWEMTFHLRSNVALPAATDRWIAGQWAGAATVQKWFLGARTGASGLVFGIYNSAGVRLDYMVATPAQMTAMFAPGVDVWLRVRLTATGASGFSSPDGVTWTLLRTQAATYAGPRSSTSALAIGVHSGTTNVWDGRIYSAQASSLDASNVPTSLLWRFDADEYPVTGGGTSYVDPRGRTWTLSAAGAITPKVPATPPVVVPPDVCPVGWDRPFARADISTRVMVGRDAETAVVLDDVPGQTVYGVEPFERTDLLTVRDDVLAELADRILRTRDSTTAPRVRAVVLDARTSDEALDLMTTVDVYKPSRYRCRLRYPRGDVFDAEHFATAVVHELTPKAWTLALSLDLAAPYAATGGRWDQATWDTATWAGSTVTLAEAWSELAELAGAVRSALREAS